VEFDGKPGKIAAHNLIRRSDAEFMAKDVSNEIRCKENNPFALINLWQEIEPRGNPSCFSAAGGSESQCGWLKDKFGLFRQIASALAASG
jgi:predicted 3-demethylubiquinone-9 3-methyltransferase (glyoxalase superfamily)